jgi:hypothetical protein
MRGSLHQPCGTLSQARACQFLALTKRGEATRRKLLEAAEEVFADLGYHEASIVKITAPRRCGWSIRPSLRPSNAAHGG